MDRRVIGLAVFVPAMLAEQATAPLDGVEVAVYYTLSEARAAGQRYGSYRIIETWQLGGRNRYGQTVEEMGLLNGTRPPVEPFTGGFRRG